MTTRIWEGRTEIEHTAYYANLIIERDIPNYRKTKGFVKLTFLKRQDSKFTYFKLITFWKDVAAIKNFTGPNWQKAVAYKEDEKYVIDFPGSIMHYEVFTE